MYSVYKLNKQGDDIQPWCIPFIIWQLGPALSRAFQKEGKKQDKLNTYIMNLSTSTWHIYSQSSQQVML